MATDKLVDFDHVTDYISREAATQKRHGCNMDCSTCDFALDGDSWCKGELFVVDLMRVPAEDVRPVAEISNAVDEVLDFLNDNSNYMPYHIYSALFDLVSGICPTAVHV